ncbi:hypothetical protein AMEX_G11072 [Astyanax mexicanus]|uniref:Uncharacterized protein n=1 Tax=Astyanax mexicanus TaxID=7994 RepID=A0A8T2LXD3_ASTMX|nr:hypothetical protein AMEX_G11072 [Astyanax mexicanus]
MFVGVRFQGAGLNCSSRRTEKMRDEAEVEIIDSFEHCEGGQNHNSPSETGALVEVTFQKDPNQELKYLEAEPKALGVTQISLSLFLICISITSLKKSVYTAQIVLCGLSTVGIIAGSVAIAAQSLRLPKLKACLGMQIVLCVVSIDSFFMSSGVMMHNKLLESCWDFLHENYTSDQYFICERLSIAYDHVKGLEMLALGAQIAISATLSAFCCKVIQCCSPRSSIPIIVLNAPSAP